MEQSQSSKTSKRPLQFRDTNQTDMSAWRKKGRTDPENSVLDHQPPNDQKDDNEQDSLEEAFRYFEEVQDRVSLKNSILQKHLTAVESVALQRGLPPEGFNVLLDVALSGKFGDAVNTRILRSLIPASVVPEDSVVSSVSWLCVSKCSGNVQLLFLKWLITVFDFIDHKEQLNALYGFFFSFLQEEKMCPFVCHLLYLLTRKENVKPFRVRRLLDLQAKMGTQPYLQALLSLYKLFCPELVTITLPRKMKHCPNCRLSQEQITMEVSNLESLSWEREKIMGKNAAYFRDPEGPWKAAINTVRQRNQENTQVARPLFLGTAQPQSQKRKWNTQISIPASSTNKINFEEDREKKCIDLYSTNESFPVEQLQTFSQLLQNIHRLEFPSQMGSVLTNPLLLHYMNCFKDESVNLRLYYWMEQTLQQECTWCVVDNSQYEEEFKNFLETVYETECFLQEGFSSCEEFLYKSLPLWDGFCCRSQILRFVSWIPLRSCSEIKSHLYNPLAQLFFTSSLYFKCSVLESLKELLQNWLNCQVTRLDSESDSEVHSSNTTLSGLVNTIAELIHFVGWISTVALRLESNHTFLLHFILDFYETVCDMYLRYDLPLLIMPPPRVFYAVLLGMDSVNLNQLCYIMHRYRTNLVTAKENELSKKKILQFKFSNQTYQEYNKYLTAMVGCLWTSNVFQKDIHPQGIAMDDELLKKTEVPDFKNSFNIVCHPALMSYAFFYLQQAFPDNTTVDFSLIKGKEWNRYLEYLYLQGLDGLKVFIESSVKRISQASHSKSGNV